MRTAASQSQNPNQNRAAPCTHPRLSGPGPGPGPVDQWASGPVAPRRALGSTVTSVNRQRPLGWDDPCGVLSWAGQRQQPGTDGRWRGLQRLKRVKRVRTSEARECSASGRVRNGVAAFLAFLASLLGRACLCGCDVEAMPTIEWQRAPTLLPHGGRELKKAVKSCVQRACTPGESRLQMRVS